MIYIFLSRNCFSCATWLSSVENKNWILENYSFILLQFSIGWSYFFETDQCFLIRWFSVLWFTSPKHVSIFFFVFIFCTRTKYCIHFLLMFSTVVVIISFRRMSAMCVTSNIGGCFYCEIFFFPFHSYITVFCVFCLPQWQNITAFWLALLRQAKGALNFGTDYLYDERISFWHMGKLFWERYELLQVIHGVVLNHSGCVSKKHFVKAKEQKQLRKIFAILVVLTPGMGKGSSFEACLNSYGSCIVAPHWKTVWPNDLNF